MGRGALVFKGEKVKKKKKKSKHSINSSGDGNDAKNIDDSSNSSGQQQLQQTANKTTSTVVITQQPAATAAITPSIRNGTGKITTSGTVVTGLKTRFTKEVAVGDAILIINPIYQQQQEMRVITMCLSDISLNVSSPFSTNYSNPISFQYIPKPKNVIKEAAIQQKQATKDAIEREQHAFGSYKSNDIIYRERTEHGNYRFKKAKTDKNVTNISRSELLNLRSKKTSDKYC